MAEPSWASLHFYSFDGAESHEDDDGGREKGNIHLHWKQDISCSRAGNFQPERH